MTSRIVLRRNAMFFGLAAALLASGLTTAKAQKFALTVTPLGHAAKEKPVPAAATVGINVTIRNEASEPLKSVVIVAKLNGLKLSPDSEWKIDGEDAKLEVSEIDANQEIVRQLNASVQMAPLPPGRSTEILVEAKAGSVSAAETVRFHIADCAAAFQADLTRLRIEKISDIWPTAEEMRRPDTSLPRTRYFQVRTRRGDLATIDRLAAGYQARLLTQYEFFTEGVRYTARRWSDELKAFSGQEPNPGICAVNSEMYEGVRKTITYVTARLEPPMKAHARSLELLRKHFNAEENDDLGKIALKVAEAAGVKFEGALASNFEFLAQTKERMKDLKITEEQQDSFSLLESAIWVEAQAKRSKKLYDLIDGSITGIADAQRKNCICAF